MTQPLFLKSVFQEKIWGGDHLKTFGYDLPTDKIGEYWAISAHPNGLSTVKNGEFAGPKRVWLLNEDYPGLAMSRSFGDRCAASVGVISEPGKINLIKKKLPNGLLQKRINL